MTTILCLDTSTSACSVALFRQGTITQRFVAAPREHTRLLLPMIDNLLEESGLTLSQLDALAFTAGPGSFTGLRIGFGVIQGLAFGASLPVIAVSTLAVLALAGARQAGLTTGTVLPALDARMGEVYWGLYGVGGGTVTALMADQVSSPARVAEQVDGGVDLGVGDGWLYLADNLAAQPVDRQRTPDAYSVAELAAAAWSRDEAEPVEAVELVYIRNEVSWKKRQKIRRQTP